MSAAPSLLVLGALSLLPFAALMVTSFAKMVVVLSTLRSALGTPSLPPATVTTGLALVLTLYVMAPVGAETWGLAAPALAAAKDAEVTSPKTAAAVLEAAGRAGDPLRRFLARHAAPRDRSFFLELARGGRTASDAAAIGAGDLLVLVPAFVTTELTEAFQIAFLIYLPFLVVDLVVANVLLALGMHMLSPTTVSVPFKLLLFVLADGWHLLVRGLVVAYR